jgi:ABC-type cobalamin/Fe3+-siderophores transport system ATPase subunit
MKMLLSAEGVIALILPYTHVDPDETTHIINMSEKLPKEHGALQITVIHTAVQIKHYAMKPYGGATV